MSKKPNRLDYTALQWVINNLPPKDLEIVDDMEITLDQVDNFINQEIENGGQFSIRYDYYSDCISISLVYLEPSAENAGYAISARGEDFGHSIRILIYKFFEVAKGDLTTLAESRQKRPKYG